MPAPELPRVRPFRIRRLGLRFTDRRAATPEEDESARQGFRRWTIAEWNERQPVARRDCNDHASTRIEIARRWEEWLVNHPGGTRDEFEMEGHTVVDETCLDPRLPRVDLVARRGDDVVGMLSLYNVTTLRQEPDVLVVRVMPMPGFPPGRFPYIPQAWGVASRWILENDIEFVDGTVLDVEELFFPDDPDSHSCPENDNGMAQMWEEILGAGDEEESSSLGVPKRVKRRGLRRPGGRRRADRTS